MGSPSDLLDRIIEALARGETGKVRDYAREIAEAAQQAERERCVGIVNEQAAGQWALAEAAEVEGEDGVAVMREEIAMGLELLAAAIEGKEPK